MSKRSRSYVSGSVDIRTFNGFRQRPQRANLKLTQNHQRRTEATRFRMEHISGLSFQDHDDLMAIDDDDDGYEMRNLPPGEEGMFLSHEGGEDELCRVLLEAAPLKHKRHDARTRHDRTEQRNKDWAVQHEDLVTAYLTWQANLSPCAAPESQEGEGTPFEIFVVDFFETSRRTFRRPAPDTKTNVAMVLEGYIGTAPNTPSVALSFQVLEVYRQYHRVCPRLSVQAHVRALCHLHKIPYWKGLVEQFSHTYDIYLGILHGIEMRVRRVLKQDTPDWRMQNACAPCLYTLENEPPLKHSLLTTIDGNQSLKLVDSAFRSGTPLTDSRHARSDYWIPPEEVDRFKDEVGQAKRAAAAQEAANAAGGGDVDIEGLEGESSPDEVASICVERWRAAGPEARKKMFALFAVSGVFVCLCRHGHILIMCDMVRSGELMKYPLAIINKLLQVYGPDVLVGYDIGCEFWKTLDNSCLGAQAREKRLKCIVPAFHGHSHNRGCQVQFLPLYFEGAGKEDFEGCERLFSESNALAPGTRLATPFHRHQAIEQFAAFWSRQKHAESGNFIYNNYKQALDIIRNDTEAFDLLADKLKITHDDCERYLVEERAYLAKRKSEPPEVARKIDYVAALVRLESAGKEAAAAQRAVGTADPFISVNNASKASKQEAEIKRLRTRARTTHSRWQMAEEAVLQMEEELNIEQRWVPGSEQYLDGIQELSTRKYRCALDNLERLVIQRMFELTKLGMSGIGYKMREKIGKALKTRAEAIRHALEDYNKCAAALKPPRPALSWLEVMEMASLAEFDLLRDAREDIREYAWAKRFHRQVMNLHFNIARAREEIQRLNVEIPRLFTSLIDRHFDLRHAISTLTVSDPALAYELELQWIYDDRISARIAARIYQTAQLKGFSGTLAAGKRVGRRAEDFRGIELPTWACSAAASRAPEAHDVVVQPVSVPTGDEAETRDAQGGRETRAHSDETGRHSEIGEPSNESEGRTDGGEGGDGPHTHSDEPDVPGEIGEGEDEVDGGIPGIESEGDAYNFVDFLDALG